MNAKRVSDTCEFNCKKKKGKQKKKIIKQRNSFCVHDFSFEYTHSNYGAEHRNCGFIVRLI